jgi:NADH-quinone oxidoreductase subunit M
MIAYSSVGHMGFVLLGFATLTPVGINGALFANVAHGLITGLLFFLAGAIKERYGTVDMTALGGGMLATLPRLGAVLTFAAIASLGLPGLAGFWGEMLALFGAFQPADGLSRPLFLTYMVIGGLGAVLTAAYFVVMLSRVTHGRPSWISGGAGEGRVPLPDDRLVHEAPDERPVVPLGAPDDWSPQERLSEEPVSEESLPEEHAVATAAHEPEKAGARWLALEDIRTYELAAWTPLVVLILLFGLWPGLLLSLTTPAVQTLLGALS